MSHTNFHTQLCRGTWRHLPWFCVAGVALTALGGALGPDLVAREAAALCVAGVALGLSFCVAGVALGHIHGTLHGRRGTWSHLLSFCVASVALGHIHGTLHGRRGTWSHLLSFCVAGVALGHIHLGFAWQAWHHLTFTLVLCGRRGTHERVTPWHFAWQAWHLMTSTVVSRVRRGIFSHSPWFCVAGLALMALGGALGPLLVARDAAALCVAGVALGDITFVSRGRRGTISHSPWFCVASLALDDIHRRFTWQAWHLLTFTLVLRGRRGTHGTGWRAWARFSRA